MNTIGFDITRIDESSVMLQFFLFSILIFLFFWLFGAGLRALIAAYLRGQYAGELNLDEDGDELAQNAQKYIAANTPSALALATLFYAASAVFLLDFLSNGLSWYLWSIGSLAGIAMGIVALISFSNGRIIQGSISMSTFVLWGGALYYFYAL